MKAIIAKIIYYTGVAIILSFAALTLTILAYMAIHELTVKAVLGMAVVLAIIGGLAFIFMWAEENK